MRRIVVFAIVFASVGFGAWAAGKWATGAYERLLASRIQQGLTTLGIGWAGAEVDGLTVTLSGRAPDDDARAIALDTVSAIARNATVIDDMEVRASPPVPRPPVTFDLLRDSDGITLTGNLAGALMRSRIHAALAGEAEVFDLAAIEARQPDGTFGPELEIAAVAARRLDTAQVSVATGRVVVRGIAPDEAARRALTEELMALAGDEVELVLELRTPSRVITPFVFAAERGFGAGRPTIMECTARNAGEQAMLDNLIDRLDPSPGTGRCPAGIGGPEGDWTGAITAGLDALAMLPAGHLMIEGTRVTLTGRSPTDEVAFAAAMSALTLALPEGFDLTGRVDLPPNEVAARSRLAYWLRIRRPEDGLLIIFGIAPSLEMRDAQLAYAASVFGTEAVQSRLEISTLPAPEGWNEAVLAAMTFLALMTEGEAELAGNVLAITGRVLEADAAPEIHRLAADNLPGFRITTAIEVDVPAAVAEIELPATPCAAQILDLLTRRPILFDAGSSRIAGESAKVMDDLVAMLGRCPGIAFEIGGHTDSQGAAEMNLRLSKARAEAVMDRLVAAGIPPARLSARGYGEAAPIADNATADGRALNRRIEFRPVAASDTAVEGADAVTGQLADPPPGDPPAPTED